MSKVKKQCSVGYSCGKSCISLSKACRVSFPEGVAVSLENRTLERSLPIPSPPVAVNQEKYDPKEGEEKRKKKSPPPPKAKAQEPLKREISSLSKDEINAVKKLSKRPITEESLDQLNKILLTPEGYELYKEARKQKKEGMEEVYKFFATEVVKVQNSSLDIPGIPRYVSGNDAKRIQFFMEKESDSFNQKLEALRKVAEEKGEYSREYRKASDDIVKDFPWFGEESGLFANLGLNERYLKNKWRDDPAYSPPMLSSKKEEARKNVDDMVKRLTDLEDQVASKVREAEAKEIEFLERADGFPSEPPREYKRTGVSDNLRNRGVPVGDPDNPEERKLQEIVDARAPMMAISRGALNKILKSEDKDFKNAYEIAEEGTKAGIAKGKSKDEFQEYLDDRKKEENLKFGLSDDTPNSERPVYGFMGNGRDLARLYEANGGNIGTYGEIILEFKPEVKDDITVTVDDSLGGNSYNVGSPANAVSKESVPGHKQNNVNLDATGYNDIYDEGAVVRRSPRYIEWQSGGKLDISNLSRIHIPLNDYFSLPKATLKQLEEAGVEVNLISPRG